MAEPLISVIVPIYKVEQYLRQCVDSILTQTYTSLEVILVDDGSPDGCGAICDEYAAKDARVVVIHKENGGLSDARNAGLDIARGEYIGFVDSDDWIEPDMYECLHSTLIDNDADISICGVRDMPSGAVRSMPIIAEVATDTIDRIYVHDEINISVWNRLYKGDLFKGIRFPKGRCFEDIVTTYKLFSTASVISTTARPLYNYLNRDDSISRIKLSLNAIDHFEQWQELIDITPTNKLELRDACKSKLVHACLVNLKYLFMQRSGGYSTEHVVIYSAVMKLIDLNYNQWMHNKSIPIKHKAVLTVAKLRLYAPFWKLGNGVSG